MSRHNLITAPCHDRYVLLFTIVPVLVAANTLWALFSGSGTEWLMWYGGYDGCFSQWGYKMLYWSQECTCITACRSKKCVPACAGNAAYPQPHIHTLPGCLPLSVSLDGSFNESQFPTACHITPLNDLINQARHLLSLAISLFTRASTAVTQFSFLALSRPLSSGLYPDHIAMP